MERPPPGDVPRVLEEAGLEMPIPAGSALWYYHPEGPVPFLHRCVKFHGFQRLGERLGSLLGAVVGDRLDCSSALEPATIVPVPLHPIRYAERGYNQAEAIAVGVGRALGLPVSGNALLRTRLAASQVGRTREDRLEHIRETFAINPEGSPGGAIILVDDVVTTGATMRAAVDALRHAGLTCLHVAALAVVMPQT